MNIFFVLLTSLSLFSGFKDKIKEKNVKLVTNEYDLINSQDQAKNWREMFLLGCFCDHHSIQMHDTYKALLDQMVHIGLIKHVEEPPYLEFQDVAYSDRADLICKVKKYISDDQADILARAFEVNEAASSQWFNLLKKSIKNNPGLLSKKN